MPTTRRQTWPTTYSPTTCTTHNRSARTTPAHRRPRTYIASSAVYPRDSSTTAPVEELEEEWEEEWEVWQRLPPQTTRSISLWTHWLSRVSTSTRKTLCLLTRAKRTYLHSRDLAPTPFEAVLSDETGRHTFPLPTLHLPTSSSRLLRPLATTLQMPVCHHRELPPPWKSLCSSTPSEATTTTL